MGETPWLDDADRPPFDATGAEPDDLEDVGDEDEDDEVDPMTADLRDQVTGRVLGTIDDEQWDEALTAVLDRYWPEPG